MSYPPLATFEEKPLHEEPNSKWAHDHPPDAYSRSWWIDNVRVDWRCPECVQKAHQFVRRHGNVVVDWTHKSGDEPQPVGLTWLIKRAVFHLKPTEE